MAGYTRRDILRMATALATGAGLGKTHAAAMAQGFEEILSGETKVLWLQGMACTGCSVSLLNSDDPGPLQVVTEVLSVIYHSTVMAAQGDDAMQIIEKAASEGGYFLVVEGSVPLGMPEACIMGGKPFADVLTRVASNAAGIVAAGTCSAFGGIPAAEGNLTGAVSMREFMEEKGIPVEGRLINCPGCPVHPQSLLGTVAHTVAKGIPALDPELLTPDMFYRHTVHDECPLFHYWEKEEFAEKFGDEGCLFKLGCLGPTSHTSCARRQWNGAVNWCIRAGAPCNGCSSPDFARIRDFPFYRNRELAETNQMTAMHD